VGWLVGVGVGIGDVIGIGTGELGESWNRNCNCNCKQLHATEGTRGTGGLTHIHPFDVLMANAHYSAFTTLFGGEHMRERLLIRPVGAAEASDSDDDDAIAWRYQSIQTKRWTGKRLKTDTQRKGAEAGCRVLQLEQKRNQNL
jgi:hypothetical protein